MRAKTGSLSFDLFRDIEHILASVVVANWRQRNSLLVLRGCSRAFRDAIDAEIDAWCRRFTLVQRKQEARLRRGNEAYYEGLVQAERMLLDAFGTASGLASRFMHISLVDRRSYMALLTERCLLCKGKYSMHPCSSSDGQHADAEETSIAPCYVFAHKSCQRKHMVVVAAPPAHPIQRCAEPKALHKELCTVSQMNTKGVVIDYSTVKSAMSDWFNTVYAGKVYNAPMVVWLEEHPLVRKEDTLYGAMGITREDVDECVRAKAAIAHRSHQQLEQKRAQVAQAKESLAATLGADLRVWLGKGYTRWRSIEDLDSFHPRFLQSTLVDQFVEPMSKRTLPSNISAVFHMLSVFHETLNCFQHALRPVVLEWVIAHLGVHGMAQRPACDDRGFGMQVVAAEASLHTRVLTMLANCAPNSITVTKCARGSRWKQPNYRMDVRLILFEKDSATGAPVGYEIHTDLAITEASLCKFKYVVNESMGAETASKLPRVPTDASESEAGDFLNSVLRACFSPTEGSARVHALSLVVDTGVYRKIVSELRASEKNY